jgi:predicted Zn-dependent protease
MVLLTAPLWAQTAREVALGEALANEMRRESQPVTAPRFDEYLQAIGSRLAGVRLEAVHPPEFREPAALPDGRVMVPGRFLLEAANEGEFVAMLAHVAAHASLRHGVRAARAERVPVVFVGAGNCHVRCEGQRSYPSGFAARIAAEEREADQAAADLLQRAGFPPAALRGYLVRHGAEAARIGALPERGAVAANSPAFAAAREELRGALAAAATRAPSLRR